MTVGHNFDCKRKEWVDNECVLFFVWKRKKPSSTKFPQNMAFVPKTDAKFYIFPCKIGGPIYEYFVTSLVCLPVTPTLSAAALELPHPTQVDLLPPATPQAPRMTWQTPDVVTVVCPAQATTIKTTRKTEEELTKTLASISQYPSTM